MALEAVIFDLDGTLVDALPGIEFSVAYSFAEAKLAPRKLELGPLIGPPIRQIFAQLMPEANEQQLSKLESAFRTSYDSAGWRKTVPCENAAAALTELKRAGVQLYVATNKPALPTGQILKALGILDVFQQVLCRDSIAPGFVSKAEMLRTLIEEHKLEPAQSLYVGDTYDDYLAAQEAGIPVALVQYGNQDLRQRLVRPPIAVLNSLLELLDEVKIGETA